MTLDIRVPANAAKSQEVRLFDVFVLAPFLVWVGFKQKNQVFKFGLIGAGVATAVYNYQHHGKICRAVEARARSMAVNPDVFASYRGCWLP